MRRGTGALNKNTQLAIFAVSSFKIHNEIKIHSEMDLDRCGLLRPERTESRAEPERLWTEPIRTCP